MKKLYLIIIKYLNVQKTIYKSKYHKKLEIFRKEEKYRMKKYNNKIDNNTENNNSSVKIVYKSSTTLLYIYFLLFL